MNVTYIDKSTIKEIYSHLESVYLNNNGIYRLRLEEGKTLDYTKDSVEQTNAMYINRDESLVVSANISIVKHNGEKDVFYYDFDGDCTKNRESIDSAIKNNHSHIKLFNYI